MPSIATHSTPQSLTFSQITPDQFSSVDRLFHPAVKTGRYFCIAQDADDDARLDYWFGPKRNGHAFIATNDDGFIVGSYYLRPNYPGPGSHVANAGYVVAETERGRGIASQLCAESLAEARRQGYRAMQFNCVVSTNGPAIHIWKKTGFAIIGTLPRAYHYEGNHYVDAYVMYKEL